jgi:plasmid stabilization system protein ParE
MRSVVWSRRALSELTNAIDYLAQHNLLAAQKIEARVVETTEKLANRPIGRPGKHSQEPTKSSSRERPI